MAASCATTSADHATTNTEHLTTTPRDDTTADPPTRSHAQWEMDQGLAGMFIYSADMDTKDYKVWEGGAGVGLCLGGECKCECGDVDGECLAVVAVSSS